VARLVGASGVLYITDAHGKVIAHPNPSVVLRMTQALPERKPGIYIGMMGELVILSSEQFRLGEQSFFVITETPLAESLTLSRKTLFISLFMLLLFLLFAVSFGVFMVSQIASPIESLAITAAAISKGDFYHKADEQGYLEISTLAKSFNDMTSQLVGNITELRRTEQKLIASKDVMKKMVLERTIELQRTNEDLEEEIVRRGRTEEFLRRYLQIVNTSHDYISFVGRNYQYLAVNESYLTALGRKRSEVVSRHVQEVWGPEMFEKEIKEKIDRAFAGNKVQYEMWLEIGIMGRRFYEVAMTPYQEEGREVNGVVVNIRDATARWNLEKNLRQAEKMKAVGTLASGIAHDFNNVLHNIFGCARVAQQNLAKESDAYYWLSRLQQVGERAAHLIRQIQSFSRQPEPVKIPLSLQSMIQEVLRFQELSLPSNIEVRLNIAECRNVMADATQVHQVFANLLSNGIQAMSPQGGILTVDLEEMECLDPSKSNYSEIKPGRYVQVAISDTGVGMEKDVLERIFEPFFTTKSFGKGTGLGLSISHGILVAHEGAIAVTSEPGKGTTFQFCLPLTESPTDNIHQKKIASRSTSTGHILYVDDEEVNNEVWKAALEKEGFSVITALSGDEALALFDKNVNCFDLIITDQKMPGMTGIEFAKKLDERGVKIPIILVTGWSDNEVRSELKKNSIQILLNKPVNMDNLLKSIDQLLRKKESV
jgi:PAS domain S-box-containing protein